MGFFPNIFGKKDNAKDDQESLTSKQLGVTSLIYA